MRVELPVKRGLRPLLLLLLLLLLPGEAVAQYPWLDICSHNSYDVVTDATSSRFAAVEVVSHLGVITGELESTFAACTIALRPSGNNDEVAVIAGFLDQGHNGSTTIQVGNGPSTAMQTNTFYNSSSPITITHTLMPSGRGFRATVFGVPRNISISPICDHDRANLPSTALTRVVSHPKAGISEYPRYVSCTADVPTSPSISTYGFFQFFDLESCCGRVRFSGDNLASDSVLLAHNSTTASNSLSFTSDYSSTGDGFILDLYRVAGFETRSTATYLICDSSVASSPLGIIRSHAGSGSSQYARNARCSMSIRVPEGFVVAFQMKAYDSWSCCDNLRITYDGTVHDRFFRGQTFASENVGEDVQLYLTLDGYATPGFTLYYQIVSTASSTVPWSSLNATAAMPTSPTGTPSDTREHTISTTLYTVCSAQRIFGVEAGAMLSHREFGSRSYGNNLDCTAFIEPISSVHYVHVYVDDIELWPSDPLVLSSGAESTEFTSSDTFVGQRGTPVRVVFRTDSWSSVKGFRLLFQSSRSSTSVPLMWDEIRTAANSSGSHWLSELVIAGISGGAAVLLLLIGFAVHRCTKRKTVALPYAELQPGNNDSAGLCTQLENMERQPADDDDANAQQPVTATSFLVSSAASQGGAADSEQHRPAESWASSSLHPQSPQQQPQPQQQQQQQQQQQHQHHQQQQQPQQHSQQQQHPHQPQQQQQQQQHHHHVQQHDSQQQPITAAAFLTQPALSQESGSQSGMAATELSDTLNAGMKMNKRAPSWPGFSQPEKETKPVLSSRQGSAQPALSPTANGALVHDFQEGPQLETSKQRMTSDLQDTTAYTQQPTPPMASTASSSSAPGPSQSAGNGYRRQFSDNGNQDPGPGSLAVQPCGRASPPQAAATEVSSATAGASAETKHMFEPSWPGFSPPEDDARSVSSSRQESARSASTHIAATSDHEAHARQVMDPQPDLEPANAVPATDPSVSTPLATPALSGTTTTAEMSGQQGGSSSSAPTPGTSANHEQQDQASSSSAASRVTSFPTRPRRVDFSPASSSSAHTGATAPPVTSPHADDAPPSYDSVFGTYADEKSDA